MVRISSIEELQSLQAGVEPRFSVREDKDFTKLKTAPEIHIRVCRGSGCIGSGSEKVTKAFEEAIRARGLDKKVKLIGTGCHGLCEMGPIVQTKP